MLAMAAPVMAFGASAELSGHWAEETLSKWTSQGWLVGDENGSYNPNSGITRAEFIALLNRMKGYNGNSSQVAKYTDVTAGAWYYNDIQAALAAGIISGTSDTTMSPNDTITRQEAIAIVARVAGVDGADVSSLDSVADNASIADWAKASVAGCVNAGLAAGTDGSINPLSNITRAESVVLLNNVYTDTRSYAFAGTFGPASGKLNSGTVNILVKDVSLRNIAAANDLVINKLVGEGDVRLESVDVNGALRVEGGGLNSVYVNNSTVSYMIVDKDNVRIVVDKGTSIRDALTRGRGNVIEFHSGVSIDKLIISGEDNRVSLSSGVTIDTLDVDANDTKIETEEGTVINTLNLNASAKVVGAGEITVANITANDVEIEKKPENVNISNNVTAKVEGDNVSGGSTNSSSGDSSAYAPPSSPGSGGSGNTGPVRVSSTISYTGLVPVAGEKILKSFSTSQYDASVSWSIVEPKDEETPDALADDDSAEEVFNANTQYEATITLTTKTGYTLSGVTKDYFRVYGAIDELTTNEAGKGVVKTVFPKTAPPVEPSPTVTQTPSNAPTPSNMPSPTATPSPVEINSVEDLIDSVHDVINSSGVNTQEKTFLLTSNFYEDANASGQAIALGVGLEDNKTPIIIKGTASTVLNVGFWIANDKITIQDLKINIGESTRTFKAQRSEGGSYCNAILLGHGTTDSDTYTLEEGVKDVTIKNCDITITGLKGSGIYVEKTAKNLVIENNTVKAARTGSQDVQALAISVFDPSITIKGNTLSSSYNGSTRTKSYDAPASSSALYIERVNENTSTNNINITNNTLSSEQCSFLFKAFPASELATSAGLTAMRTKGFATKDTSWAIGATDSSTDNIRSLLDALLKNTFKNNTSFGAVLEAVDISEEAYELGFEIEQYEIESNAITAISYRGHPIVGDKYDVTAEMADGKIPVVKSQANQLSPKVRSIKPRYRTRINGYTK
jgi:hypothetical protein